MTDLDLAEDHEYVTEPGGKPKISVSRIANLIDDGKADGLMRWVRWLADNGQDYEVVRNYKADRGTRVHNHMPLWARGESVEALPDEMGFLDGIAKWRVDSGAVSIEQEQVIVSSRGYGGRFDDISEIDGELWGIDYKTGKVKERACELQHAGYWNADGIAIYDDEGNLTGTRPLPPVTRWACVNPHEDGTYDFIELPKRRRGQKDTPIKELQDAAWHKFCLLLEVFAWLHPTKGVIPA